MIATLCGEVYIVVEPFLELNTKLALDRLEYSCTR